MLNEISRVLVEDKFFGDDETESVYESHRFVRVSAKELRFENVNFSYSTFEACYFRKCTFVRCNLTGCKFLGSNLRGSVFSQCKFDYVVFERTIIAEDVLEKEAPQRENLKADFARTLRTNFQQLGDANAVNKAIRVELQATAAHLSKAWRSPESYYREKYIGARRLMYCLRSVSFATLDFLWGNGESALKLLRTVGVLFIAMGLWGGFAWGVPTQVDSYWFSFKTAPSVFLGTVAPGIVPRWYLTCITAVRFTMFGAFISILTKRLNRR